MSKYLIYGLVVHSDSPLPLPEYDGSIDEKSRPCVRLLLQQTHRRITAEPEWFSSYSSPGNQPWLRQAKVEGGYVLRFAGKTDFWVGENGSLVTASKGTAAASRDAICRLAIDQVLPQVVNLLGRVALHATAIVTPYGICAFVGTTGAGKSTLAASFSTVGYPVFCDDCLAIGVGHTGRVMAFPGCQTSRLWSDSAEAVFKVDSISDRRNKMRIGRTQKLCPDEKPLMAIFDLKRSFKSGAQTLDVSPRLESMSEREGMIRLLRSSYRLDTTDRSMLRREFNDISRLVKKVPMRRLYTVDDFDRLPVLRRRILDELELIC